MSQTEVSGRAKQRWRLRKGFSFARLFVGSKERGGVQASEFEPYLWGGRWPITVERMQQTRTDIYEVESLMELETCWVLHL
mmetsp:Transcript_20106/g.40371  ORF Transcript_20106/g.40371 Transcript_20106/m.40371 type:complete len:81 (+) Transcript_20106:410-652(+)